MTALVTILAIGGPVIGFYIHDRDAAEERIKDLYIKHGDNTAKITDNTRSIEDMKVDFRRVTDATSVWQRREQDYDHEVRERLIGLNGRIDNMQLILVEKAFSCPDFMAVPASKYPR